jgi:carboxyl-terminal processing protease
MNNTLKLLLPLIIGAALIIGIFMGRSLSIPGGNWSASGSDAYTKKLHDILEVLEREYVDSIDKETLFEQTISEMLHRLDPHSNYIPARDLLSMTESIQGQFGGVGVRFTIIRDTLNITHVIEGSPSYFAGIQAFDKFIAVDDESIAGVKLSNTRVQELLKGEAGTNVNVTVLRNGKTYEKRITRGMVPIQSIVAAHMVDNEVGYIRLNQFSVTSDKEFYDAAMDLKSKGMKKLIFDLRYNGGGVMGAAINIADAFLERGLRIVSTKGKNQPEEVYYSEKSPFLGDVELVILTNESSASASEIVAGAIQDNDRGLIMGRRTFGKGLVQQDINLKDGSNLRLTISRYYTPSGRCIQRPYSGDYDDYVMDEFHRYNSGELYQVDSTLFVDSLKYLTRAGRPVFGGGGVMPDVFIPLDTTGSSVFHRRLQYSNAFADFAYDYIASGRVSGYKTVESFDKGFTVTNAIFDEFIAYAKKYYELEPRPGDIAQSRKRIETDIKSEIARLIWLENGLFLIRNKLDKEFLEAYARIKKGVKL